MVENKQMVKDVAARKYLSVLQQLSKGVSANDDWKGQLPLRTAVLVGDLDMVALLMTWRADPTQEPSAVIKATQEGEVDTVHALGKNARMLAAEMASDIANPLHREARGMLQIMADPQEARRRVVALQGRLEEEIAADMRSATTTAAVSFGARPLPPNPREPPHAPARKRAPRRPPTAEARPRATPQPSSSSGGCCTGSCCYRCRTTRTRASCDVFLLCDS